MRLLLVGGGHASIYLLKHAGAWVQAGIEVTLLNDHPTLFYSGMVPEYLGGVYAPNEVQIDLVRWCERTGVAFRQGRAVTLTPQARTVTTETGAALGYDVAVFDIGAANPLREKETGAVPTKPLHRIETLAAWLRGAENPKRLVIVGGGAAGVEVALNISAQVAGENAHLSLLEKADRLLPDFPEGMGRYAGQMLRERGVNLRTGVSVAHAGPDAVQLDNAETLTCDRVLWATGATGQPLFRDAGLPVDDKGFVRVEKTLQVHDHPNLFAAGDCAVVAGHETLARVGVHAVKQGPLLFRNVNALLRTLRAGQPAEAAALRPFRPHPVAPLILSTGKKEALLVADGVWMRGAWALRLKHLADLRWMNRYTLGERYGLRDLLHTRSA